MFHFEHAGILRNVMTLGKGIVSRRPAGLPCLRARNGVRFRSGDQGGTFNGNPLMTAVGYAVVLRRFKRRPSLADVERNGGVPRGVARAPPRTRPGEVRGQGLLLALELRQRKSGTKVVEAPWRAGC